MRCCGRVPLDRFVIPLVVPGGGAYKYGEKKHDGAILPGSRGVLRHTPVGGDRSHPHPDRLPALPRPAAAGAAAETEAALLRQLPPGGESLFRDRDPR